MRASRILHLSLSLCVTLGALWGFVDASTWNRRNHYWQARFYWLASETYGERLFTGIAIGVAAGLVVALLVRLVLRMKTVSGQGALGALSLSLAVATSLSFLGMRIVHDQVARHPNWRF